MSSSGVTLVTSVRGGLPRCNPVAYLGDAMPPTMIWLATVSAWRWHWLNLNQSGAGELRTEKVGQDRNDARVVAWI